MNGPAQLWGGTANCQKSEAGDTKVKGLVQRNLLLQIFLNLSFSGNALRGSINTPIQGGAADVVMKAMLVLAANQRFKDLGWEMVLQVHDEIICEGPEESVEEAMSIVRYVPHLELSHGSNDYEYIFCALVSAWRTRLRVPYW